MLRRLARRGAVSNGLGGREKSISEKGGNRSKDSGVEPNLLCSWDGKIVSLCGAERSWHSE